MISIVYRLTKFSRVIAFRERRVYAPSQSQRNVRNIRRRCEMRSRTELVGAAIIRYVPHPARLFITAYGLTMVGNHAVFQPPRYASGRNEPGGDPSFRNARGSRATVQRRDAPRYRKCGLLFYRVGHKSDERSYAISGFRVRATSAMPRTTARNDAEISRDRRAVISSSFFLLR